MELSFQIDANVYRSDFGDYILRLTNSLSRTLIADNGNVITPSFKVTHDALDPAIFKVEAPDEALPVIVQRVATHFDIENSAQEGCPFTVIPK